MSGRSGLVGRTAELERLLDAVARARIGKGSLTLVAGEAGVGKTSLLDSVAADAGVLVLRGAATQGAITPYGPLIAAFRSHLRTDPGALTDCGALTPHMAILLPELGPASAATDRATLFEAIRCALASLSAQGELLFVLDDLHWSDAATLELLAGIAEPLADMPVAMLGAYR